VGVAVSVPEYKVPIATALHPLVALHVETAQLVGDLQLVTRAVKSDAAEMEQHVFVHGRGVHVGG